MKNVCSLLKSAAFGVKAALLITLMSAMLIAACDNGTTSGGQENGNPFAGEWTAYGEKLILNDDLTGFYEGSPLTYVWTGKAIAITERNGSFSASATIGTLNYDGRLLWGSVYYTKGSGGNPFTGIWAVPGAVYMLKIDADLTGSYIYPRGSSSPAANISYLYTGKTIAITNGSKTTTGTLSDDGAQLTWDSYTYTRQNISVPAAPANVSAVAEFGSYYNSTISVSWNAITGAAGYYVYRSESESGPYALVNSSSSSYYTDTSVTAGKTYWYKVSAYNIAGEGVQSGAASATATGSSQTPSNQFVGTWSNGTPYFLSLFTGGTGVYGASALTYTVTGNTIYITLSGGLTSTSGTYNASTGTLTWSGSTWTKY
ncbi:MAG: hypothetical protein LBU18_02435 [Treponema sp.]|jgi:hypothetical protein|nr:hypothetical protein [Treponema sp.]